MYDYIIVGAGSAGSVLASRLTKDPEISALLLEARGDDSLPEIHDPSKALALPGTVVDWAYITEEEPHLNNRKIYCPRGKVLGRTSSINYMTYSCGDRYDFDHWQTLSNQGWGYESVLPYFKKAETWTLGASAYRGGEGPLEVWKLPALSLLTSAFIEAGQKIGWLRNDDYNGASEERYNSEI